MSSQRHAVTMTVGELSRHTGVPPKALRAYTDWGLIYTAGRSAAGYRVYHNEALWCVRRDHPPTQPLRGGPIMTADQFATTIIEKLFADTTGISLMSVALRLLANGEPITIAQLADAAGVPDLDLAHAPSGADIEYDDGGRIVGWGLTLNPTPHRFTVNGRRLYTWCAADTLLFPAIIGQRAQVESPCPTTHTPIRLTVDPVTGVGDLQPATAVISIPGADELDPTHVRVTACNPGRFFATTEAAAGWLAAHPTGRVLPVAAGYDHVRPISTRILENTEPPAPGAECC